MPRLIKVMGASMAPGLNAGDYIITFKPRHIRAELIYVIEDERRGPIIKRVTQITQNFAYYASDNPNGICGKTSIEKVRARAFMAITPKGLKRL